MPTLRYTDSDDYAEANSRPIDSSFFADPTHRYTIAPDFIFFGTRDETTGETGVLEDTGTAIISNSGLLLDFSDNTGGVNLTAAAADDILRGGAGDDTLNGGDGDDVLEGGAGADSFDGGDGFDTVSYANASQGVYRSDLLPFANSGDTLGDSYNNIEAIRGSAYGDTFILSGNFVVEGGAGDDDIATLGGTITASYVHSQAGVRVDLSGATGNTGGDAEGDTLDGVTGVIGSRYADTLIGASAASVLKGYGGEDTITGGAGDDTIAVTGRWAAIDGGDGFDRLIVREGGGSLITIQPDSGSLINIERVVVANNTVLDLSGQTAIDGSIKLNSRTDGVDFVFGTNFDDRIVGGLGIDILLGGLGRDRLTGGLGGDIFAVAIGDAGDTITDFSGHNGDHDTIAFAGGPPPTFVEAFSASGAVEVRVETVRDGLYLALYDGDGDGDADASIRVRSTDTLTADDFYSPAGSSSAHVSGLAQHPAFVEALQAHDITGLI